MLYISQTGNIQCPAVSFAALKSRCARGWEQWLYPPEMQGQHLGERWCPSAGVSRQRGFWAERAHLLKFKIRSNAGDFTGPEELICPPGVRK